MGTISLLMLKICINKEQTITIYTLYETCRDAVRCSAFLSSITFPIYFRNGMQHRWLMLASFSRTFIYWSRIWRKIKYLGKYSNPDRISKFQQIGYMMLILDNCLSINFQFWPWENGFRSPDSTNHQGKL